jgi:hypothetical protein
MLFSFIEANIIFLLQYFDEENENQPWKTISQKEVSKKYKYLRFSITDQMRLE